MKADQVDRSDIQVSITLSSDVVLSADDIWPDGDEPENPTAQDVVKAMEAYGSKMGTLRGWSLMDALDVWVDVGRTHAEAWAPTAVQRPPTVTERTDGSEA